MTNATHLESKPNFNIIALINNHSMPIDFQGGEVFVTEPGPLHGVDTLEANHDVIKDLATPEKRPLILRDNNVHEALQARNKALGNDFVNNVTKTYRTKIIHLCRVIHLRDKDNNGIVELRDRVTMVEDA